MSVVSLLRELSARGVELALDGDRLRVNAPRGALTPELTARLKAERDALIEILASARGPVQQPLPPLVPGDPAVPAPLSRAQHRLWFLDQLHPPALFLNLPFSVRLKGPLDVSALRASVAELGRRHPALCSAVISVEGRPCQVVQNVELALEEVDLSHPLEGERDQAIDAFCALEANRPFDLRSAPLIRFFLIRVSADEHLLYYVTHHVVFDGFSHDLLLRDLKLIYEAHLSGNAAPDAPPVRFADYVRWHVDFLSSPAQTAHLEYWKRRLSGMPGVLELPTDGPRPQELTGRSTLHELWLEPSLVARLRRMAASRGATLNMVALAAAELLLARYTGQSDFGIGMPTQGRAREEARALIGMFINTVVVRSDVPSGGSFSELLRRVRDTALEAITHEHTPFDELVQTLQPSRESNRTPLYQVLFSYQDTTGRAARIAELEVEYRTHFPGWAGTDISFWLEDHGERLQITVEVLSDVFDPETAARFGASLRRILEAVAENPDAALEDVPVIALEDEQRLFYAFNDTQAAWEQTALVHRLFERQVDRSPQHPALSFEDVRISFEELDRRANQVAHALVSRGVGPDVLVGVCLRRSVELVVALLAVLKAGGAYVPLDPTYPPDRIAYILSDSRAKVLLATEDLARDLSDPPELLLLDRDAAELSSLPTTRLDREERPSQLAYVIYTSGSTGRPKGVMVEHRNVVSFFLGMQAPIGLDPSGVWLSGTSTSFDISVLELFGSLCHGRTVALLGETVLGQIDDPRYTIPALIERHAVTHFQCTPSQARILLLEPEGRAALAKLKKLIVGGEALPQELADELTALLSGELVNAYGPTETTVWSTTAIVERGARVTIGRPIANTCVFVLDERARPVPLGAVGELCIGGPGVTRGYLGRPELTAERFIENRIRPDLGQRLYRTGDLVRFRADGSLVYLGRNDFQVKVRGHRIELGEIESVVRKEPGVSDVVVVARGHASDQRLVAYLVKAAGYAGHDALRARLAAELPDHMLPSAIVELEALPLTPNGKVDRKALPEPAASAEVSAEHVLPRDALERELADIWARALNVPRVGLTDNFFDLGGHSLLAVRIFNEINQSRGLKLPLAALFECPTLGALAMRIRELQAAPTTAQAVRWTTLVPIEPSGTHPPIFCVAGIGGNPMNARHLAKALGKDQPFYGLQHRGVDGQLPPHRRIEDMAAEFLEHVREIQPRGPYYLTGYSAGGLAAYELAQRLVALGESVPLLVLFDTVNPTLPSWSLRERVAAHVENARRYGIDYFRARLISRFDLELSRVRKFVRAKMARHHRFEYRHEAVEVAFLEAIENYVPEPYCGHVLLIRSTFRPGPTDGIGYRSHESNGWRSLIRGSLSVVQLDCMHHDILTEQISPRTAEILKAELAEVRARPENVPQSGERIREGARSVQIGL
ncbi:MAG TPA: amino acid adenylation domain-containing protein [Polyangiaceae bacterium]|nr:amino acid adenylation domain-containing protein [Polyangiaceae bacterium]